MAPLDAQTVAMLWALGLNVIVGYAGLLDLGYVAFFAIGAYTMGWLGSGFFGGAFQTRDFNGEIFTEAASGSPILQISQGLPGGLMDFTGFLFTPSSGVALVYGPAASFTVPSGPCAGTALDLQPVNATSPIFVPTDINGAMIYTQYVPPQGAGKWVQAVDVSSCAPSNAVQL